MDVGIYRVGGLLLSKRGDCRRNAEMFQALKICTRYTRIIDTYSFVRTLRYSDKNIVSNLGGGARVQSDKL